LGAPQELARVEIEEQQVSLDRHAWQCAAASSLRQPTMNGIGAVT
jgi:hypothetical protein